jgi:hypothetical protein
LAIFKAIAKSNTTDSASAPGRMKHFLLGILVRKIALKLLKKDYSSKSTDSQTPVGTGKTTTRTKVTSGKGDTAKVSEFTVESTTLKNVDTETFDAAPEIIRFLIGEHEKGMLDINWQSGGIRTETIISCAAMGSFGSNNSSKLPEFKVSVADLLNHITSNSVTLIDRIADIYVKMCSEALLASRKDSKDGLWLNENRLTRKSRIDGTLSASVLLETFFSLVDSFADIEMMNVDVVSKTANNTIMNQNPPLSKYQITTANNCFYNDYVMEIMFYSAVGPKTENALRYRALNLLIQGSSSDNLSLFINENGNISDLDGKPKNSKISMSQDGTFENHLGYIKALAVDRDIPLDIIVSIRTLLEQTSKASDDISNAAKALRGDGAVSDEMKAIREFVQKDVGKNFMASATSYSVSIAQERLSEFSMAINSPAKRKMKISDEEVMAIDVMLKHIASDTSPNVNMLVIGLPGDFIDSQILPDFSLAAAGFKSASGAMLDIKNAFIRCETAKEDPLSNSKFKSVMSYLPLMKLINEDSFAPFSGAPPVSVDDLLNRVKLKNGQAGIDYINGLTPPNGITGKVILQNEVFSFLGRRLFSCISSSGTIEHTLVKSYTTPSRSAASVSIARVFAQAAGVAENIFDNCFLAETKNTGSSSVVKFDANELLKLSIVSSQGTGITVPQISTSHADLFYDIFECVYFYSGIVADNVFASSYFDKTFAVWIGQNKFVKLTTQSEEKYSGTGAYTVTAATAGLAQADSTQTSLDASTMSFTVTGIL